jgi:acyl-CoA synthetase (AMP-forming)/AMP-acid ligase II
MKRIMVQYSSTQSVAVQERPTRRSASEPPAREPSRWTPRLDADTAARYRAEGIWLDRTIADRLDELCERAPAQTVLIDGGRSFDAATIRDQATRLARALWQRGLRAGDVVTMQLPNWHEAMLVELACAIAGFVCNPIVHIYRGAEVDFIVSDAGSKALFIPESFRNFSYRGMAEELRGRWSRLEHIVYVRPSDATLPCFQALLEEGGGDFVPPRPDPDFVKLIMYTSGTTSRAKGVLHTHNTIATEIANFIAWLKLDASDAILMPSPLGHITGYLYGIQLPVTLGCPAVLMEAWDLAKAVDLIERHGVTFTIGATPFLQELANYSLESGRKLPSLRYFPTGGAPVPPEVVAKADRAFERAIAFRLYGSTEAPTVTLGVTEREAFALRANTEGYVVGHEIKLVDADGTPVPQGEEGEIVTRGPEVCVGYALAEQNAEAFDQDGYFRTGDLARQTPEGCLIITGRKKDIIIRGGENLSPKEIEDVLYTSPAIREAAVVAMPHPRLGETCCAFVTLKPGASFDFAAMQKLLAASGMAKQKYPERLEIADSLPYTAAGKIRKNLLRDQIAETIRKESAR